MSDARHLLKHFAIAYQKQELEKSYQRGLQIHTLKEELAALEKKLKGLMHKDADNFRVGLLRQRVCEIKHLFP